MALLLKPAAARKPDFNIFKIIKFCLNFKITPVSLLLKFYIDKTNLIWYFAI